jgi:hypothetical protein
MEHYRCAFKQRRASLDENLASRSGGMYCDKSWMETFEPA